MDNVRPLWPDYVYRLFRRGAVSWKDTVHSLPVTQGTGKDLPTRDEFCLIHRQLRFHKSVSERIDRYTQASLPASIIPADLIAKPVGEFLSQYFARKDTLWGYMG